MDNNNAHSNKGCACEDCLNINNKKSLNTGGIVEGQRHSECNSHTGCGETFIIEDRDGREDIKLAIELEDGELVLCERAMMSKKIHSFKNKTTAEIIGNLNEYYCNIENNIDSSDPYSLPEVTELKGDEGVINRKNSLSSIRYNAIGIPKDIASTLNSLYGHGIKFAEKAPISKAEKGIKVPKMDTSKNTQIDTNDFEYQKRFFKRKKGTDDWIPISENSFLYLATADNSIPYYNDNNIYMLLSLIRDRRLDFTKIPKDDVYIHNAISDSLDVINRAINESEISWNGNILPSSHYILSEDENKTHKYKWLGFINYVNKALPETDMEVQYCNGKVGGSLSKKDIVEHLSSHINGGIQGVYEKGGEVAILMDLNTQYSDFGNKNEHLPFIQDVENQIKWNEKIKNVDTCEGAIEALLHFKDYLETPTNEWEGWYSKLGQLDDVYKQILIKYPDSILEIEERLKPPMVNEFYPSINTDKSDIISNENDILTLFYQKIYNNIDAMTTEDLKSLLTDINKDLNIEHISSKTRDILTEARKYILSKLDIEKKEKGGNIPETSSLRAVRVVYENGDAVTTSMAPHLSDEDIKEYFAVGKKFNIGSVKDNIQAVKSVEILKELGGNIDIIESDKIIEQIDSPRAVEIRKKYTGEKGGRILSSVELNKDFWDLVGNGGWNSVDIFKNTFKGASFVAYDKGIWSKDLKLWIGSSIYAPKAAEYIYRWNTPNIELPIPSYVSLDLKYASKKKKEIEDTKRKHEEERLSYWKKALSDKSTINERKEWLKNAVYSKINTKDIPKPSGGFKDKNQNFDVDKEKLFSKFKGIIFINEDTEIKLRKLIDELPSFLSYTLTGLSSSKKTGYFELNKRDKEKITPILDKIVEALFENENESYQEAIEEIESKKGKKEKGGKTKSEKLGTEIRKYHMNDGGRIKDLDSYKTIFFKKPQSVSNCETPTWVSRISESIFKGSKVNLCSSDKGWFVSSIEFPRKRGLNSNVVKKNANLILKEVQEASNTKLSSTQRLKSAPKKAPKSSPSNPLTFIEGLSDEEITKRVGKNNEYNRLRKVIDNNIEDMNTLELMQATKNEDYYKEILECLQSSDNKAEKEIFQEELDELIGEAKSKLQSEKSSKQDQLNKLIASSKEEIKEAVTSFKKEGGLVYQHVDKVSDITSINEDIRNQIKKAKTKKLLDKLVKRSMYLYTLSFTESWEKDLGKKLNSVRKRTISEYTKTAKAANQRAKTLKLKTAYDTKIDAKK